jgi:hypothetical protein
MKDIPLLKVGRHFRLQGGDKIIVARNKQECKMLEKLCPENAHFLSPLDFSGPAVILQGTTVQAAVQKMLQYTKRAVPEDARISHWYRGKRQIIGLNDILGKIQCLGLAQK